MKEMKFRTADYGIITHEDGTFEVVKHVGMFDDINSAQEKVDELTDY